MASKRFSLDLLAKLTNDLVSRLLLIVNVLWTLLVFVRLTFFIVNALPWNLDLLFVLKASIVALHLVAWMRPLPLFEQANFALLSLLLLHNALAVVDYFLFLSAFRYIFSVGLALSLISLGGSAFFFTLSNLELYAVVRVGQVIGTIDSSYQNEVDEWIKETHKEWSEFVLKFVTFIK